ncbi:MAG: M6 family metalloprotease domain-containing protein [Muribaculaceae bacterium]|nr:M6 family metalloprotease domain-containing protein [Muribaculaceae bacterium]
MIKFSKTFGKVMRCLFFAGAAVFGAAWAHAIPAYPWPITVTQPDGTNLTIRLEGDEHGYLTLTEDGVPIVQNSATGLYEYARLTSHGIECSGIAASSPHGRDEQACNYVRQLDIAAIQRHVAQRRTLSRSTSQFLINDFPTTGSPRSLVILVEFSDVQFTSIDDPYQYYHDMLNQQGFTHANGANGSARDFYHDCSSGAFTPQFDVVGPVRLSMPMSYYGGDSSQKLDTMAYRMVIEACELVDNVTDFSQYDYNSDGIVDNIYFFYAGFGQADSGQTTAIWPHAAKLGHDWHQEMPVHDGIFIDRYATSNEIRYGTGPLFKPVGIGTFVHEFGHVLGLVDHYDTGYGGSFHPNTWDTMAAASYNDNQNTPPTFSAFERAELGWLEYTHITPTTAQMLNVNELLASNSAYCMTVPGTEGKEFFVLENRQKQGWDRTLPGHGMLVWHIDHDLAIWQSNLANADPDHQRIDIVEADKLLTNTSYGGDPFPGTANVTKFDFYSWDNNNLFSFDFVEETDTTVNFLLAGTDYRPPQPEITISQLLGKSISFTWSNVTQAKSYLVTVEQCNADGSVSIVGDYNRKAFEFPRSIQLTDLNTLTDYRIMVISQLGTYESEPAVAEVTTTQLQFVETSPVATQPTDVTDTGFTAHWLPLDGAEGYSLTVMQNKFSEVFTESYGFDERADGMPANWTTNSTQYNTLMFGQAKPSLQLAKNDDYIEMHAPGAMIVSISFWQRSQMSSNELIVEQRVSDDDEWTQVSAMTMSTQGEAVTMEIDSVPQVRIRFNRKGSYALLDDIEVGYIILDQSPVPNFINLSAGDNLQLTVNDLPHASSYVYRVQGVKEGLLSAFSNPVVVVMGGCEQGDVNGDGSVTSVDITALYNWLLDGDDSHIVNGDQDGDGKITAADVTVVYNILLGN